MPSLSVYYSLQTIRGHGSKNDYIQFISNSSTERKTSPKKNNTTLYLRQEDVVPISCNLWTNQVAWDKSSNFFELHFLSYGMRGLICRT